MTYISNRIEALGNFRIPELLKSENPEKELESVINKLLKGKTEEEREEFLEELSDDLREFKTQLRTKKKEIRSEDSGELDFSSYIQDKLKDDKLGSSRRGGSDLDKLNELEKFIPKIMSTARDSVKGYDKRNIDLSAEPNSFFDTSKVISMLSEDPTDIERNTVNVKLAFRGKNQEMTELDYLAGVTDSGDASGVVLVDANQDGVRNYKDITDAKEKYESEKDPSSSILFWQGEIPEIVAYNAAADTLVLRISEKGKSGFVNLRPVSGTQIRFDRPFKEEELEMLEAKLPPVILQSLFGGHEATKSAHSELVDQVEPELLDRLKSIPNYAELMAGAQNLSGNALSEAYESVVNEIYKSIDDPKISGDTVMSAITKRLSVLSTEGRQEIWIELISLLASYEKSGLSTVITNHITDIEKSMGVTSDSSPEDLANLSPKSKALLLYLESFTGVTGLLGGKDLWNQVFGQPYEGEVSPEDAAEGITYFNKGPWMNDELGDVLSEYVKYATKLPSDLDHQTAMNNVIQAYEHFQTGKYKDPTQS